MAPPEILEGTGEELQRHLEQHPNERFRLIRIESDAALNGLQTFAMPESLSLEEEERLLDELAALGKHLPASPPGETYSRETIYAERD